MLLTSLLIHIVFNPTTSDDFVFIPVDDLFNRLSILLCLFPEKLIELSLEMHFSLRFLLTLSVGLLQTCLLPRLTIIYDHLLFCSHAIGDRLR